MNGCDWISGKKIFYQYTFPHSPLIKFDFVVTPPTTTPSSKDLIIVFDDVGEAILVRFWMWQRTSICRTCHMFAHKTTKLRLSNFNVLGALYVGEDEDDDDACGSRRLLQKMIWCVLKRGEEWWCFGGQIKNSLLGAFVGNFTAHICFTHSSSTLNRETPTSPSTVKPPMSLLHCSTKSFSSITPYV